MKAPKNTENFQKTTSTEPTPSASTQPFVKIIRRDYIHPPWEPFSTRSNMSSKDWKEALEEVDKMMSEEQVPKYYSTSSNKES
jgi:hypothetical protein